jgi:putative transposase
MNCSGDWPSSCSGILSGLRLVALLIDGVHFAEHVVLAAVGIDLDGKKHVLGPREGATENAAACKALLEDLIERGLDPNRAVLVVIDGAKALRRSVLDTFGERALIQRCQARSVPGRAHSKEVRSPLTGKTFEPVSLGQVAAA